MDNYIKNPAAFWSSVCEILANVLPSHALKTWFVPIVPISFEGGILSLSVPSQFFLEWIESHYKESLVNSIQAVAKSKAVSYNLVVDKSTQIMEGPARQKKIPEREKNRTNINKNYSWEL